MDEARPRGPGRRPPPRAAAAATGPPHPSLPRRRSPGCNRSPTGERSGRPAPPVVAHQASRRTSGGAWGRRRGPLNTNPATRAGRVREGKGSGVWGHPVGSGKGSGVRRHPHPHLRRGGRSGLPPRHGSPRRARVFCPQSGLRTRRAGESPQGRLPTPTPVAAKWRSETGHRGGRRRRRAGGVVDDVRDIPHYPQTDSFPCPRRAGILAAPAAPALGRTRDRRRDRRLDGAADGPGAGDARHGGGGLGVGTLLGLLAGALARAQGRDPLWVGVGAFAGLVGLGAGGCRSHLVAEGLQATAAKPDPPAAGATGPTLVPAGIGGQPAA
jgi:hypothetical protein